MSGYLNGSKWLWVCLLAFALVPQIIGCCTPSISLSPIGCPSVMACPTPCEPATTCPVATYDPCGWAWDPFGWLHGDCWAGAQVDPIGWIFGI